MAQLRTRMKFPVVLWCGTAVLVFYLTCWPLVQNAWASRTWEAVPCSIDSDGKYFYDYHGEHYFASRRNFWDHEAIYATVTPVPLEKTPDAVCYLKPSDPHSAVLRLDAPQHLADGARGYMLAVVVIVVAGILSFAIRRQKGRKSAPAAVGPRSTGSAVS